MWEWHTDSLSGTVLHPWELTYKHMLPPTALAVSCASRSSPVGWPKPQNLSSYFWSKLLSQDTVKTITQAFLCSGMLFTFTWSLSTLFLNHRAFPGIIEGSSKWWSPSFHSLWCTPLLRQRFLAHAAVCCCHPWGQWGVGYSSAKIFINLLQSHQVKSQQLNCHSWCRL